MKIIRLTICLVLFSVISSRSQPPDPDSGNPTQVPITGIEILIAMGSLFGVKKAYDLRKKN